MTEDIVFYLHQAKQFGSPILELACGTGRTIIPIAQQGFEIVGIDKSEKMLSRAKEKAGDQYPITWHLEYIRALDLKRKFNLIILPFNSIAHLHDIQSINACFENGFFIENKYGDFDKTPFTSESKQQILVCKIKKS